MLFPMVSFIPMPTQTEHPIIFIRGGKSISVGPAWRGRSVEVVCHIRSHVKISLFGPRSEIKTKNPDEREERPAVATLDLHLEDRRYQTSIFNFFIFAANIITSYA